MRVYKTIYRSILTLLFLGSVFTSVSQDVSRDIEMGEQGYEQVVTTMGLYEFEALDTLVKAIGNRLVSQIENPLFNYEFHLVDSPEPNAFALPGGKVFVTRGLLVLPLNEDELAGVMGHEIIHAQNRHSIKQQRKGILGALVALPGAIIGGIFRGPVGQAVATPFLAGGELINAQYSQGSEKEADQEGIELAAKAGYNPYLLANLLSRLSQEAELLTGKAEEKSYFASHPYTPKRVKNISKTAEKLEQANTPHLAEGGKFLTLFDGLLLGPNPQNGYVTDGVLYHPQYELQMDAPNKWQTATTPSSVGLASPEGDAIISFLFEEDTIGAKASIDKIKKNMLKQNGLEPDKNETFEWYTHAGSMLEYEGNEGDKKVKLQIYALDIGQNEIMKIASMFYAEKESTIETIFKSAKPQKARDMPAAQINVMHTLVASKGNTLKGLAAQQGAEEYLPLMVLINELPSNHVFSGGEVVKVIKTENQRFE